MSADPASIPQHVVEEFVAARIGMTEGERLSTRGIRIGLAAVLTALMDDEPVKVLYEPTASRGVVSVRPSDVLAAVLTREAS